MNYRHAYHAGNFADVFKHIVLVALTNAMLRKETAFCYLDTHAGTGVYDLFAEQARKSKEYESGIAKILAQPNPPVLVQQFLNCVTALNPGGINPLRYYPGSPAIVRHFLRPQDRMVLTELHEEDYNFLKNTFRHDKQVGIHHLDGYQALKAFLPPKERRGFVLVDPPYEVPDELSFAGTAIGQALERWAKGIYALWYPIKERRAVDRFHHALKDKWKAPILIIELSIHAENLPTHLNGSGIAIVNPPWKLAEEIKAILPWVWATLSPQKQGRYEIKTL